jgi:hypothetical protein
LRQAQHRRQCRPESITNTDDTASPLSDAETLGRDQEFEPTKMGRLAGLEEKRGRLNRYVFWPVSNA